MSGFMENTLCNSVETEWGGKWKKRQSSVWKNILHTDERILVILQFKE